MNSRAKTLTSVLILTALAMTSYQSAAQDGQRPGPAEGRPGRAMRRMAETMPAGERMAHHQMMTQSLQDAQTAIANAMAAIEQNNTAQAMQELRVAQDRLNTMQQRMTQMHQRMMGGHMNARCPMTGRAIPQDVPAEQLREHHDEVVAFCCPQCPAAWDKLTEEQKEEKLRAARSSEPRPSGETTTNER